MENCHIRYPLSNAPSDLRSVERLFLLAQRMLLELFVCHCLELFGLFGHDGWSSGESIANTKT